MTRCSVLLPVFLAGGDSSDKIRSCGIFIYGLLLLLVIIRLFEYSMFDIGQVFQLKGNFMLKKWLITLLLLSGLTGCGYNTMQTQDEAANAAWSEVVNQYQRRADLIPNLVNTVKGYASHEKDVLTQVTAARSRVGSIQLDASTATDPKKLNDYAAAQQQLGSALSRLLVVSENYPQLKADGAFRDLQAQLEGTENRIALARKRYIDAIQSYNSTVRTFPGNLTAMAFGLKTRPNFTVENEKAIAAAPTVSFGQPASAGQ